MCQVKCTYKPDFTFKMKVYRLRHRDITVAACIVAKIKYTFYCLYIYENVYIISHILRLSFTEHIYKVFIKGEDILTT